MSRSGFEAAAAELLESMPAEFVARRKEIAGRLRHAGDRETAALVAGIRKPPAALWTANRLARRDPEAIEVLLRAAAELESAQTAALSGKARSAQQMRSA